MIATILVLTLSAVFWSINENLTEKEFEKC